MTRTRILHMFCIAAGALFVVLFLRFGHRSPPTTTTLVIETPSEVIPVTIADTAASREQGLSNTPYLPVHTGKLFIFPTPGKYGFWMKDMHYPLDIVWIDEDFRVVGIAVDATPESYPSVFYPPQDVLYVLEINANEALVDNMAVGTQLQFRR